jgi:hypothetical protein
MLVAVNSQFSTRRKIVVKGKLFLALYQLSLLMKEIFEPVKLLSLNLAPNFNFYLFHISILPNPQPI